MSSALKPIRGQRQVKYHPVQGLEDRRPEPGGKVKVFGRMVGYMDSPEKPAVMAGVVQGPVQEILRDDQHRPIGNAVTYPEQAEPVHKIEDKKGRAVYSQV